MIRVVVAKPGLDGHDRGARVIARALRDAGMEVVYTGLHQTPEDIVNTCVQEDADVCALSILSGAHMALVPRVMQLLKERDAADIIVMAGGIIPEDDVSTLLDAGVASVMGPGTPTDSIIETIRTLVAQRGGAASGG
ncbi:cobalamin B12-binding domain-containing protein [bacterium]|nr:cobalamin B12-binding domain-containing protein [bacterium]